MIDTQEGEVEAGRCSPKTKGNGGKEQKKKNDAIQSHSGEVGHSSCSPNVFIVL